MWGIPVPAILLTGNWDVSVMRKETFLSTKLSSKLTNSDALNRQA